MRLRICWWLSLCLLACGAGSEPTSDYPNVVKSRCVAMNGGYFATAMLPQYNPAEGMTLTVNQCDYVFVCNEGDDCPPPSTCNIGIPTRCTTAAALTPDPTPSGNVTVSCGVPLQPSGFCIPTVIFDVHR